MGSGTWNASTYAASTGTKISSGSSFGHDKFTRETGKLEPHESLDPFKVAKNGIIESRDSDDHPNSVPIVIGLDQTGSMARVPRVVQQKLGGIFDLLMLRGYIEDPQIAVGAYGDCYCDPIRSTVQFSNFESDNRIDDAIDNLILPGYGGRNGGETMSGLFYMMDKVRSDAWEKRGKKGYAFFVADEISLDLLPEHVRDFVGDAQPQSPLEFKALAEKIMEKWEVFILLIDNASAHMQGSEAFYTKIFGKRNVLVLEEAEAVAETIALAIGVCEGTVDIDEASDDLKSTGANELAIRNSVNAVTNSGLANLAGGGKVAAINADVDFGGAGKTERL